MNVVLVEARKKKGLTITQASRAIGLSHGMLAMLETKKRRGSDATKVKVAEFYERSIEELFYSN